MLKGITMHNPTADFKPFKAMMFWAVILLLLGIYSFYDCYTGCFLSIINKDMIPMPIGERIFYGLLGFALILAARATWKDAHKDYRIKFRGQMVNQSAPQA